VLPGHQPSNNPVAGTWHSLSVSTPSGVHIVKTSQFPLPPGVPARRERYPGPVASPDMSAVDPVGAQPASLPAENTYDVILIGAGRAEYTSVSCARAARLSVTAASGNRSGGVPTGPGRPGRGAPLDHRTPRTLAPSQTASRRQRRGGVEMTSA